VKTQKKKNQNWKKTKTQTKHVFN